MDSKLVLLILGMGLVTYIPRMLPFFLFRGKELPRFVQGILKNVPYATLGALIFPGVLFIQEDITHGIVGAAAAFILAFMGGNIFVVIIGAIAVLTVYSSFF